MDSIDMSIEQSEEYLEHKKANEKFKAALGVVEAVGQGVVKELVKVEGAVKLARDNNTTICVSKNFRDLLNSKKHNYESVEMFLKRSLGME